MGKDIEAIKNDLCFVRVALSKICQAGHHTGYDWNKDVERLTLLEGQIFSRLEEVISELDEG